MLQITRAHGNLIENALFFLILMFLLETVAEVSSVSLMVMGDIFLLARIAHAYGITRPEAKSILECLVPWAALLFYLFNQFGDSS